MNRSHLAVNLFLLIVYHTSYSQTSSGDLDTLINEFVNEKRLKGVDTFFVYQDYCVGCSYRWNSKDDKCNFEGLCIPTFVIWCENGQTYMTKKDNCFDFPVLKVEHDSLWRFYFANRKVLEKEEIRIPQYVGVKDGKEYIYSSTINHSIHYDIKIIIGQDTTINQDLDEYYFTKEIGIEQHRNINYEHNINSLTKKLQELIERTITSTTQGPKWTKVRR